MYLDKIIVRKEEEVAELKRTIRMSDFMESEIYTRVCYSLRRSLLASSTGIISEFKRKSPSKGFINENAKVDEVVPFYEKAGAAGISVLADTDFFAGAPKDIRIARELVGVPILFKEFVIDEIQLHLAKSCGADVVLLIAACLTPERVAELAEEAKRLGLEVLLELHSADELGHINKNVDIVGINNRNLKTFEVDLQASIDLMSQLPNDMVRISESGISSPDTIKMLREKGFQGFLIGENFMKTQNPGAALKEFIDELKK